MQINSDSNSEKTNCRCCGGETVKAGKFTNVNGLVQRFQCKTCGKFTSTKQPLDGVRIEQAKVELIVNMLCEGVGVLAAARLANVDKSTVLNVLECAGRKAEALMETCFKNYKPQFVEIDEVYGFVGCLQSNTEAGKDESTGDQYAFMAIDAVKKLILHVHVGKRNQEAAMDFLDGVNRRYQHRFQLTSDGFKPYIGRDDGVRGIFGSTIDYGIEVKRYGTLLGNRTQRDNPVACKSVRRAALMGSPKMKHCTVNHAERTNLSIRLFNRRFTRKTLGYSRKLANHRHAIMLQAAHFNFCRVHSSLGQTPAQAAGISGAKWSVAELLA